MNITSEEIVELRKLVETGSDDEIRAFLKRITLVFSAAALVHDMTPEARCLFFLIMRSFFKEARETAVG